MGFIQPQVKKGELDKETNAQYRDMMPLFFFDDQGFAGQFCPTKKDKGCNAKSNTGGGKGPQTGKTIFYRHCIGTEKGT